MITREMILEELNNKNLKYGDYETNLIIDYLINIFELNLLPENIIYKDSIEKLDKYNVSIVFFDDNHEVNQKWWSDFKGNIEHKKYGSYISYLISPSYRKKFMGAFN